MKKFLLIASIILLTTVSASAQNREMPADRNSPAGPIIRTFPNPATTVITFDFQKSYEKGYSLQVYNFLGKKMFESMNVNDRTTVDLGNFTRGVYVYQLRDRTGKILESGKFQVSK